MQYKHNLLYGITTMIIKITTDIWCYYYLKLKSLQPPLSRLPQEWCSGRHEATRLLSHLPKFLESFQFFCSGKTGFTVENITTQYTALKTKTTNSMKVALQVCLICTVLSTTTTPFSHEKLRHNNMAAINQSHIQRHWEWNRIVILNPFFSNNLSLSYSSKNI